MNESDIFMKTLGIEDAEKRREYLDQVCGVDATLRERIETLLASHRQAGSLLEHPVVEGLVTELPAGEQTLERTAATKTERQWEDLSLDFLEVNTYHFCRLNLLDPVDYIADHENVFFADIDDCKAFLTFFVRVFEYRCFCCWPFLALWPVAQSLQPADVKFLQQHGLHLIHAKKLQRIK